MSLSIVLKVLQINLIEATKQKKPFIKEMNLYQQTYAHVLKILIQQ